MLVSVPFPVTPTMNAVVVLKNNGKYCQVVSLNIRQPIPNLKNERLV